MFHFTFCLVCEWIWCGLHKCLKCSTLHHTLPVYLSPLRVILRITVHQIPQLINWRRHQSRQILRQWTTSRGIGMTFCLVWMKDLAIALDSDWERADSRRAMSSWDSCSMCMCSSWISCSRGGGFRVGW